MFFLFVRSIVDGVDVVSRIFLIVLVVSCVIFSAQAVSNVSVAIACFVVSTVFYVVVITFNDVVAIAGVDVFVILFAVGVVVDVVVVFVVATVVLIVVVDVVVIVVITVVVAFVVIVIAVVVAFVFVGFVVVFIDVNE